MLLQAPVAAPGEYGYTELQEQTYMGETFWKAVPPAQQKGAIWESDEAAESDAASLELLAMNHMALGVQDVENMTRSATPPLDYFKAELSRRALQKLHGLSPCVAQHRRCSISETW